MLTFHCDTCSSPVFYENIRCLTCGSTLGIIPGTYEVNSVKATDGGLLMANNGKSYRFCKNSVDYACCNQLVLADDPAVYCRSCQFTEITPNLTFENNRKLWVVMEKAKRRLLFSLFRLGLYPVPKSEDSAKGLAFRFLVDNSTRIMTGHQNGVITITLAEADDAIRAARKQQMGEGYRTLLGHFRHEIGHYYWNRLIADRGDFDEFRSIFGDETQDYQAALDAHYAKGEFSDWKGTFISKYASAHPWEDWAETFAHFLHMRDVVETSCAVGLNPPEKAGVPSEFREMIDLWLSTTFRLNELGRSIGSGDLYPFILSDRVIAKMEFIHRVIVTSSSN
ncbi:MAG: putative zinc-binding metallopeptidase [Luteolibacter sp.]